MPSHFSGISKCGPFLRVYCLSVRICNNAGSAYNIKLIMTILLNRKYPCQVTAFGGDKVIHLLHIIERCHQKFTKSPIGPIGAHLVSIATNFSVR